MNNFTLSDIQTRKGMKTTEYSSDFISLRRAIFMNFIAQNAPIREDDLTPEVCRQLIYDIGEDYIRRNKRGIAILSGMERR